MGCGDDDCGGEDRSSVRDEWWWQWLCWRVHRDFPTSDMRLLERVYLLLFVRVTGRSNDTGGVVVNGGGAK